METEFRFGRTVRRAVALLSFLLIGIGAAAAPSLSERLYRDARRAMDRYDIAAALAKADAALAQLSGANDEWTMALRVLRGEALIKQNNLKDGLPLVTPDLQPAFRYSEAEVRRQLALGIAASMQRSSPIPYFERAMKIAADHQPKLQFDAHLALANVLPFDAAEPHLKSALSLARKRNDELGVANAQNALLFRYARDQQYARAVDAGEKAIALYTKLGVAGRVSSAAGNLGWAYLELGDYESAAELFARAETIAKAAGLQGHRVTLLNHRGNVEFTSRRYGEAARYYRQALDLARAIGSSEASDALTNLARAGLEQGNLAEAKKYNAEAGSGASPILDARVAMLSGELSRAEQTLKSVIAKSDEKQTKWEAQAWLAQLYARQRREAEADVQFREALNTAGATRKAIDKWELRLPFFNLVDEVFDRYVAFLVQSGRKEDALAVTERMRAEALEEGVAAERLDAKAIAKQSGATILSYWLGRDRSYVFVITPANVDVKDLQPDTTIEKAVERYQRELAGPRGTLQLSGAKGEELYRLLIAPVGAIAKGARVAVIADGRLHALNFETLVLPSPQRYWIEDVVVTNASSLRLLARGTAKRDANASMLLVGNPPVPSPEFPPLPRAGEEINSVARHFAQRTVLAGAKATPAAYRAAAPGNFAFVHFVAHGVATRKRPLDSAVILARDPASGYKLFARDIVEQPLRARLVTISSCHGAGTRTYSGEGLVGLAWAFLKAGADQVIAALWEVNDSATPELMDRMYARIREGADPAVALRDAKLTLVRGKGSYKKPMYWAPFVLYSGL